MQYLGGKSRIANSIGFRRGKVIEGDGQLCSNRQEVMAQCIKHINRGLRSRKLIGFRQWVVHQLGYNDITVKNIKERQEM